MCTKRTIVSAALVVLLLIAPSALAYDKSSAGRTFFQTVAEFIAEVLGLGDWNHTTSKDGGEGGDEFGGMVDPSG